MLLLFFIQQLAGKQRREGTEYMFVYQNVYTDDAMRKKVNKIIRRIRMRAGCVNVYLICLAGGRDNFDIIDAAQLKQKCYPTDTLYICGMAKGKDSAIELAAQMYLQFMQQYDNIHFKDEIMKNREKLFRRR